MRSRKPIAPIFPRNFPAVFRVLYFVAYLAFRLCEGVIHLLPLEAAFLLGRAGGELAYRVMWRRRTLALVNLQLAFGAEKSETELRAINREHFQLLGANLFSGIKAAAMSDEAVWARVTANLPQQHLQTGWVALISHIGNWELFSHLGSKFPEYRFGAVYQGLANPYIDRYLRKTRTASGGILFDRRSEMLKCVRFLREGGVVGVLIDQGAGYAGLWTPLFSRLTSSSTLAALLAIRSGHPVIPMAIYTTGRARWEMVISDPVYAADDDAEAFTAQINRLLEAQIRRSPADWLWAHKRWKPLRPHVLFARDQRRVYFPPEFDRATLDPFRILIVLPAAPDEAAAAQRAVHEIKQGRPDTWLALLASPAVAESWRDSADVDAVIISKPGEGPLALSAEIRRTARFDIAIFFANDWKPSLAVRLARIPIRVGRPRGLVARLYNQHPADPPPGADPVRANLQIAHSVGANVHHLLG